MSLNPNAICVKAQVNDKDSKRFNWYWVDPVYNVGMEKRCSLSELQGHVHKRHPSKTIIFNYCYERKSNMYKYTVGETVNKVGGSYQARGTIKAIFKADDGSWRYVFRFDDPPGLLHIFNEKQLGSVDEGST